MRGLTRSWYVLLFILVVALFLYDNVYSMYKSENEFTLEKYLENPQKYGGHKGQRFGKIINISQDHFYFNLGDSSIRVSGSGVEKSVYGDTVVFLYYRKDGVIELIDYHHYNYNYLLYVVSFLAFIIFLIIFFNEWKVTWRGFENA